MRGVPAGLARARMALSRVNDARSARLVLHPVFLLESERNMPRPAFTAKVFAIYLFIAGTVLVVAPNFLLSIFRIPETSEVWIRVIGVLAFNLGVYAWAAAEDTQFLGASVYARLAFFVALTAFALLGLASPMIILLGVPDLLGAIWTHFALKADARSGRPLFTTRA